MPRRLRSAPVADASLNARERMLDAATTLFLASGAHATTIRDIAEQAEVNSQLIYYYFGDKAGLVRAVLADASGRVQALLAAAAHDAGTPRERLASFIEAWVRVTVDQAPTIRMLHRVVEEDRGKLVATARRAAARNAKMIRQLIGEGIAAGEFRRDVDPRLAAASLVGMTHYLAIGGPILMYAMSLENESRLNEKLAKHTAALFLRGIGAPPPRSRRHD